MLFDKFRLAYFHDSFEAPFIGEKNGRLVPEAIISMTSKDML